MHAAECHHKLSRQLDGKDRHGLVLVLECAIASDGKHSTCLELYSQNTGLLVGSVKMGKLTIHR